MKLAVGLKGIEYVMGDIFFKISAHHFGDFLQDGIQIGRELERLGDKNRHKLEFIWVVRIHGSHLFFLKPYNARTISIINGQFYHVKPYAPKSYLEYQTMDEYREDCFIDSITKEEAIILCEKGGGK